MILVSQERIADYTQRGWWGSLTLWDWFLKNLNERGDAQAVVDAPNRMEFAHGAPQRLSWKQLSLAIDALSLVFVDQGIERDDIVVVQLPNVVEQFVVYLTCARLGVVVTPVPVQYRAHELDHILSITNARLAISFSRIGRKDNGHEAAQMFVDLQKSHPSLRKVWAWGDDVPSAVGDLAEMISVLIDTNQRERIDTAETNAAVTANDVFTICWTSGTEAAPKGVPRSHNEWLIVPPSIIEAASLRPHIRLLNPFPLVNMSGFSTAFATWLVLGATLVQHHPFSLPVFLQQIRDEQIDYTVAPPAILNALLHNEALLVGIDFKRLSRIGTGSAPLSDWMVQGFAQKYGVQIINYFGSNEGAALSGSDIDIPDPALRAQYFPRSGVEGFTWSVSTTRKIKTRLVDLESGENIVTAGISGELRFAGPTIFSGYYQAPALSQAAFDQLGYYRTGDLFEIAGDALQYYRYVGRSKDLVIRGGFNISSEEIEGLLAACPGVREVAVVGVPDAMLGEKLCACVVVKPDTDISLNDLVTFLRDQQHIAVYKLPEYLLLVQDALPRNPVGKILKRVLREQAKALVMESV